MENKIYFKVGGIDMAVVTSDSEEHAAVVAKKTSESIDEILMSNDKISLAQAAILAAMQFCDDHIKLLGDMEKLRLQVIAYIEEAQKANDEAAEAKRQLESMRREIDSLRQRLK